jgi:hypothetical protein
VKPFSKGNDKKGHDESSHHLKILLCKAQVHRHQWSIADNDEFAGMQW